MVQLDIENPIIYVFSHPNVVGSRSK